VNFTKKNIILFILLTVILSAGALQASGAGSRAAFTRGGWAGAEYAAMGMTGCVMADDVFAIYWNPAGLIELKSKSRMSAEEIKRKAISGDVDKISEKDILGFSEDIEDRDSFLDIGVSGAVLSLDRNACFTGVAFNMFEGVFGAGFYSVFSTGIEKRDASGVFKGNADYVTGISYISYALSAGLASAGVTLKGLYEGIDGTSYAGAGIDLGVQAYIFSFLKMGILLQDLGTFLHPAGNQEGAEDRADFAYSNIRIGLSMITDAGVTIGVCGLRKFEQDDYEIDFGVRYDVSDYLSVCLGFNNSYFTTGVVIEIQKFRLSYALSFDRIDDGYNNIVSLSRMF